MQDILAAGMAAAKEDIKQNEERLSRLTTARVKDVKAIATTKAALAESRRELALTSSRRHIELTKNLGDEQRKM